MSARRVNRVTLIVSSADVAQANLSSQAMA